VKRLDGFGVVGVLSPLIFAFVFDSPMVEEELTLSGRKLAAVAVAMMRCDAADGEAS